MTSAVPSARSGLRSVLLEIAASEKNLGVLCFFHHPNTFLIVDLSGIVKNRRMFYVYILTNPGKTVLYIGLTNDLKRRLTEHIEERGGQNSFTVKYNCYQLIYYEEFASIKDAILREKELKKWRREKKEQLIASKNPKWRFLNPDILRSS
ncbi:GIY-YIG nuclease family protein [Paraflavitalea sp. sgz302555]|uniref:GIY-YIG nuclease family protein n=2 Tax=unclassified Paraflavitalea TaxID=2798305 RepID=UPI003D325EA5